MTTAGIATTNWKNGSFLIVLDNEERILMVQAKDGIWEIPGGGIERGEFPTHASQSETEEESGVVVDEHNFRLIALLTQRPDGLVCLFETRKFKGAPQVRSDNAETSNAAFFAFDEIMERAERGEVRLGALRLVIRWKRCMLLIDPLPVIRGSVSDPVELPKNYQALADGKFKDVIYRF